MCVVECPTCPRLQNLTEAAVPKRAGFLLDIARDLLLKSRAQNTSYSVHDAPCKPHPHQTTDIDGGPTCSMRRHSTSGTVKSFCNRPLRSHCIKHTCTPVPASARVWILRSRPTAGCVMQNSNAACLYDHVPLHSSAGPMRGGARIEGKLQ